MKRTRVQAGLKTTTGRQGSYKRRPRPDRSDQITRIDDVVMGRSELALLRNRNRMELKGMDTIFPLGTGAGSSYLTTTNTNGDITVLNLVRSGNASYNRVGKSITMTSARITGRFSASNFNSATTMHSNSLRMVIVYDRQPSSGSIPTFDTIFGRSDQAGTEDTRLSDPLKYDNSSRFKIIRDRNIEMNSTASSDNLESLNMFFFVDEFIKLPNLQTIYSGQSSPMTIADISSGALYAIFRITNSSATLSIVGPIDVACRLRYYD